MTIFFRNTLAISLAGHLAFLSMFSLSFGRKVPAADYTGVAFWGAVLARPELATMKPRAESGLLRPQTQLYSAPAAITVAVPDVYCKPPVSLGAASVKEIYAPAPEPMAVPPRRKEAVVMFYPHLPYNFLLYFADRQAVHIELMYSISPGADSPVLSLKRKISSGNLEADLLAMRYLSHYLSIQQENFPKNTWQAVKIDLSYEK
jgi:hypothetical protein